MPRSETGQRYYPPAQKTGPLDDEFRQLYDAMYEHGDKLTELHGMVAKRAKGAPESAVAGSPSHTKLGGIALKGVPPQHGQSPTYNSTSGQYEPSTPAGTVKAPATSSSAGTLGQIATDGTYVYICTATNTWKRAAVSTF